MDGLDFDPRAAARAARPQNAGAGRRSAGWASPLGHRPRGRPSRRGSAPPWGPSARVLRPAGKLLPAPAAYDGSSRESTPGHTDRSSRDGSPRRHATWHATWHATESVSEHLRAPVRAPQSSERRCSRLRTAPDRGCGPGGRGSSPLAHPSEVPANRHIAAGLAPSESAPGYQWGTKLLGLRGSRGVSSREP